MDFVLTGRAENYLHGRPDLADTIARLQAYQEAGADVLFAPGVDDPADLRPAGRAVDRPVNVLVSPVRRRWPSWPRSAWRASRSAAGCAMAAWNAVVEAARELLRHGTTESGHRGRPARDPVRAAFS